MASKRILAHTFFACCWLQGASEIIIVEGEMDKLSVEEALLVAAKKQLQQQQQEQADGSSSTVAADDDSISSMTLGERPLWWKLGRHTAVLSVPAGATTGKMDYVSSRQGIDAPLHVPRLCRMFILKHML